VTQIAQKFIEVLQNPEHAENDFVLHTVAYGLGAFAYVLPKEAFAPILPRAVTLIKGITRRDEAFTPECMEATENAMGALAKIAYRHMDGTNVTEADLCGVFSFLPFKEDECECQTTHRIFLDQIRDGASVVHSANIKPAALEALNRIRAHVGSESSDANVKIMSFESKALLAQI